MVKLWRQWIFHSAIALTTTSLLLVLSIKARLVVAAYQSPQPEAILVLGGGSTREPAAAQLAAQNPDLEVWVSSSGLGPTQANQVFSAQNVGLTRVNLDYSATDTVTNFTTLVTKLQTHNIHHIYLVTSDFHMPRSKAIAFWVLGSRGITYTPITVPSNTPPEPYHKTVRDVARSWLWLITGRTGSSLDPDRPVRSS